tara:strand:+ start:367 stop:666 length:300 start_codon:yes stop_codon:yes gene_type:complete
MCCNRLTPHPAEVRGEIAGAAFYMDVRYSGDKANENDLQITNDLSAISQDSVFFGNGLATLIGDRSPSLFCHESMCFVISSMCLAKHNNAQKQEQCGYQ